MGVRKVEFPLLVTVWEKTHLAKASSFCCTFPQLLDACPWAPVATCAWCMFLAVLLPHHLWTWGRGRNSAQYQMLPSRTGQLPFLWPGRRGRAPWLLHMGSVWLADSWGFCSRYFSFENWHCAQRSCSNLFETTIFCRATEGQDMILTRTEESSKIRKAYKAL